MNRHYFVILYRKYTIKEIGPPNFFKEKSQVADLTFYKLLKTKL
jgi:hypothetical protein